MDRATKNIHIFLICSLLLFSIVNLGFYLRYLSNPALTFRMIKYVYNFSSLVIAPLWILGGLSGLCFCRKHGPNWKSNLILSLFLVIGVTGVSLRVYATHIEPYRVKTRTETLNTLKPGTDVTILHFTDLQTNEISDYEQEIFSRFKKLKPDLILNTGDLLQIYDGHTFENELNKLDSELRVINPPLGIYGVYGDVDRHLRNINLRKIGSMSLLENEEKVIKTSAGEIRIFFLSVELSKSMGDTRGEVMKWINGIDTESFLIVCGHSPDYILDIKDLPVDLCLAGHTHGGQVRMPFAGAIMTLSNVPKSWARGFRKVGNTILNVSAGLGCEHADNIPRIRFNCPPELNIIQVRSSQDQLPEPFFPTP